MEKHPTANVVCEGADPRRLWLPSNTRSDPQLPQSVFTMAAGLRRAQLGTVNLGLGVFAVLIVLRFFDSDLSFVIRGVAFVAVGCAFLATNLLLSRKRGLAR